MKEIGLICTSKETLFPEPLKSQVEIMSSAKLMAFFIHIPHTAACP
jgi:hypothetical protein